MKWLENLIVQKTANCVIQVRTFSVYNIIIYIEIVNIREFSVHVRYPYTYSYMCELALFNGESTLDIKYIETYTHTYLYT